MIVLVEWPILVADNPDYEPVASLFPILGILYVAMGIVAWWRRPSNRVGGVLALGGLLWMLSGLGTVSFPALFAVGLMTATVPFALVALLVLVFPTGRTVARGSRVVIALAYATTLVFQAARLPVQPGPPGVAAARVVPRWC